jgi:hypothetical protein
MKKLVCLAFLALIGCAQLQHGQEQPIVIKSVKNGVYYTSCSGAVETWASCYDKARITCEKSYQVIKTNESAQGGIRELTFQCKK